MKKWLYPLSCFAIVSMLSACGMNDNTRQGAGIQTQNSTGQVNRIPSTYNTNTYHYNQYTTRSNVYQTRAGFNQQIAERIAQTADSVPGVEKATAVVYRKDVVVGIQTRMNANDVQQKQVIERQVHSAVRSITPSYNVRVTSDRDMFTRISNMDNTVRNGMRNGTNAITSGPTTVTGNLANAGNDFTALLRDLGRTVTAPFR